MEFAYRKDSILNYMLLLQNIVSGFLMIFSVVLFIICLIMIKHSLTLVIEQEKADMAILRTRGLSGNILRSIYVTLYGGSGFIGVVCGVFIWCVCNLHVCFGGGCFYTDWQNSSCCTYADSAGD